ncbi:hypothetical protein AC1031_021600 [Aphanomyces cochlioides]|nr:hypothetical protein AC1031_021600 [Aphanomyces cochlioides]
MAVPNAKRFCLEQYVPRQTFMGWLKKYDAYTSRPVSRRALTLGGQGRSESIPFGPDLLTFMKDTRRGEHILTSAHMANWIKCHHNEWLERYMSNKKSETTGYNFITMTCRHVESEDITRTAVLLSSCKAYSYLHSRIRLVLQSSMRFTTLVLPFLALLAATSVSANQQHEKAAASTDESNDQVDNQDIDSAQPHETYGQVVPRRRRSNRRYNRYAAKYARRQNWFKNTYDKVKPWAGPVIGASMGAYKVYSNGKTIYNMVKGRGLREKELTDGEHPQTNEQVAPRPRRIRSNRRNRRRYKNGLSKRSARRQNWFKNAYNKVSPWAGPVIGAGMGAYNVYKNGKAIYDLAKGRKLREMEGTMTTNIKQLQDAPVMSETSRQLRGANYVE